MRPWCLSLFVACLPGGAAWAAVHLSIGDTPVIAGEAKEYAVDIEADEAPGEADRPLRVSVNVGTFGPVKRLSAGHYETRYHAPETKFPQTAIVGLWRETGADAAVEFVEVPLHGRSVVPVTSDPNVRVTVSAGSKESAPMTTDAQGKAQVPVLVAPGVREATVIATGPKGGASTKKKVPLSVPAYNRLTLAVVPHAVVADGRSSARIHVYVSGQKHERKVQVAASVGEVVAGKNESQNHFVFSYTPAAGAKGQVTFSGTVADDKASSATASLALGAQQPAELVVRPSAEEFELGASVQANVLVLDESGLGVAEMNVTLSAPGFEIKSRRSGENGVYAFDGSVKNYPKGGNLSLTATLPRTNGAPIEGVATVRIKKPAGARTARFDTAPTFLWAGSPPVPIVATVLDAVGDPVPPEGATLVAVGAVMTHPRLEGSSLTATLTPPRYPHAVKLEVRSPEGRIIAERIIDVAGDSELVYLGARVGAPGSFSSVISPRFGVEAMVRPRVFEDQILIGMMVSATAGGVTDVRSSPTGPLSRESVVALSLRFALDDLRFGPFSFQPGVGIQGAWINPLNGNTGSPALASHLAAGANIFLTASGRIGPGRAFLEVGNGVMPVSKPDLVMNASGFYVDAGYRVALF